MQSSILCVIRQCAVLYLVCDQAVCSHLSSLWSGSVQSSILCVIRQCAVLYLVCDQAVCSTLSCVWSGSVQSSILCVIRQCAVLYLVCDQAVCSPGGLDCHQRLQQDDPDLCPVSCLGQYADTTPREEPPNLLDYMETEYEQYKNNFVRNLEFDGDFGNTSYGKYTFVLIAQFNHQVNYCLVFRFPIFYYFKIIISAPERSEGADL